MSTRMASAKASPLAFLFSTLLALWLAAPATASQPVRVLIAEDRQPHFSQLGCPAGPGITDSCRVLMRIHCPTNGGGVCYENASGPTSNHATTVTKLAVYESDPDVQAIVASGSPHHALAWAIANRERFNIRVVTRTDGTAQANGGCSSANIYRNAYNKGIAVVYAAGNNGRNGVDLPTKQVIPGSCGYKVIGVGFTGTGYVTREGNKVVCSDNPPAGGDNSNADLIRIECSANARPGGDAGGPYVDFFTTGAAVPPSVGAGSSFAAPRIAALFANYFTQFPNGSVAQARSFIDSPSYVSNLQVQSTIAGVDDNYDQILPTRLNDIHRDLSNQAHKPTAGYYYNPARSGWGLHVSTLGDDVYLIWYTYDTNGKPIWFTAYGRAGSGPLVAQIREERKLPNQSATHTNFGRVTLDFINKTSFNFSWDFSGRYPQAPGTERVERLLGTGSGIGGQWFDPSDPGWGLSVEAANGTSGVELVGLYYFDSQGKPVWALGQIRDGNPTATLDMRSYSGFCQGCPAFTPPSTSVGTLWHGFQQSWPWNLYENGQVFINIGGQYPWPPNGPRYTPVVNLFP